MQTALLRKCSITYLVLPNLLFSTGWFRPVYAIPLLGGYLYLLFIEFRKKDEGVFLSLRETLLLFIFAVIWIFFCGVDGFSIQSFDWQAHNAKFYDLYKNSWPVYFAEIDRYACHYFGYYLVPAFLSKQIGFLAPSVLVLWTGLGFFLGLCWVFTLINRSIWMLILFLFLRGTGQLVIYVLNKLDLYQIQVPKFNPSIRSVFEQSTFAPNQVIPALIVCGILLDDFLNRKKVDETFFVVMLAFIWGIFPAIGVTAVLFCILCHKYLIRNQWKDLQLIKLIHCYILPGLLFFPTFIYFLSSQTIKNQGFLFTYEPREAVLMSYFSGVFIDFLMLYILTIVLNKKSNFIPVWFIHILFAGLFLMSTYRMGIYNDLFFRGSIPFCILLFILLLRGLEYSVRNKQWPVELFFYPAIMLLAFLVISLLFSKNYLLSNNIISNHILGKKSVMIGYDSYPNIYQTLLQGYCDEDGAQQYLGAKNSWYEKYLSKSVKY